MLVHKHIYSLCSCFLYLINAEIWMKTDTGGEYWFGLILTQIRNVNALKTNTTIVLNMDGEEAELGL